MNAPPPLTQLPQQQTFSNTNLPQQNQPQYQGNSINFYNPNNYGGDGTINNNNQILGNQQQHAAFSSVQSTITPPPPPLNSSVVPPPTTSYNLPSQQFEKINYQDAKRSDQTSSVQYNNSTLGGQLPPQPQPPPPSLPSYSVEQNTSLPPPPPSTAMTTSGSNTLYNNAAQQRNIQPFDSNFNFIGTQQQQQQQPTYQYLQWSDQRSHNNEISNFNTPTWSTSSTTNANAFANNQTTVLSSSNNERQNYSPSQQHNVQYQQSTFFNSSNDDFASKNQELHNNMPSGFSAPNTSHPAVASSLIDLPTTSKFDNVENVQTPVLESIAHITPSSSPLFNNSLNSIAETSYPENREKLDDAPSSLPQSPVVVSSSSNLPTLDRHNYMVTGQLSQELPSNQHQVVHDQSEVLPPPGLSRMVVGEPENSQGQIQAIRNDILPPGLNRMVTGTETTQSSYMNYQRQADGEVSHSPSMMPVRPPSHPPSFSQQQQNDVDNQQQQSFNISDRNLYLVAGESDANNQRVIPGVESDSSNNMPINIINPLQNLHIEDDEDFVNISVSTQPRNVDGDGMEELQMQQQNRPIEEEQREEDIEGANDNNVEILNPHPVLNMHENVMIPPASIELQEVADEREDIEGANDYSDPPPPPPLPQQKSSHAESSSQSQDQRKSVDGVIRKQRPEIGLSSEDSELRELEKSVKPKPRRSKKYDSNDSESDNVGDFKDRTRDKYDDRYRRSSREKMSREDYEKYRRKEKERRSGGTRSRRNDDTDGSRYGDSRRRTDDDEDDDKRNNRRKNYRTKNDDAADDDEKDRKRDKYRDPRRSKLSLI